MNKFQLKILNKKNLQKNKAETTKNHRNNLWFFVISYQICKFILNSRDLEY